MTVTPKLQQLLHQAQQQRQTLTYRQLAEQLNLPAPKIQSLARMLEQLVVYDVQQGWPLRSAIVVSQTSLGLPRQGFFDFLFEQKILPDKSPAQQQSWHAHELQRVYAFNYPEGEI